jgi:tetratricopeptide (TPR) repeat protein
MLLNKFVGNTRQALQYGEQSLAIARAHDTATGEARRLREQLAFILNDLALHGYKESGQFDLALATMEQARQLWRELNNLPMLADSLGGSSSIYATRGEYAQALQAANEARAISESIGNLWGQSYSRWVVGGIYWEYGEISRAIETMEDCMRYGLRAGFFATLVGIQVDLGILYGEMGDVERGVTFARRALNHAEQELTGWLRWPLSALARLFVWQGDVAQAQAMIDRAVVNSNEGFYAIRVVSAVARSQVALAGGESPLALAIADEELAMQYRVGARVYRPDLLLIKAEAFKTQNEWTRCREMLDRARTEAEAIGSRRMLWKILSAMSEVEIKFGNRPRADSLRAKAYEVVQFIADSSPPELRTHFLALPQVRSLIENRVT